MRQLRRFRPMGIADILDETFELYRSNFVLLIGIAAVVYVPYSILESMFQKSPPTGHSTAIYGYLAYFFSLLLVLLFAERIVTGVLTYAISERYLGREATIGASFGRVLSRRVFFPFLGAVVVKYLAIGAPLLSLIFVGGALGAFFTLGGGGGAISMFAMMAVFGLVGAFVTAYLGLRFALLESAFIVEMKGVGPSLSRSWTLMNGEMLKAFALLLVAWLLAKMLPGIVLSPTSFMIAGMKAGGPDPSTALLVIHTVLSAIVNTLAMPVISIVSILLYYDIRIRKEGFDLEMLAGELDSKTRQIGMGGVSTLPQEQLQPRHPQEQAPPRE